jgi:integrase
VAKPAWGYELDQKAIKDAQTVLRHLGTISKSHQRDRRPTFDEMSRLVAHFRAVHTSRPRSNPMHKIIVFAMFSTRRQEEITRITWDDFDLDGKRVLVRDMKNPGQKIGNDIWCELPDRAIDVIKAMPKTSHRIFPYGTDAITTAFTRACQFLAIDDLHFHDLRHEGVSRLFEIGKTIPQAASISGHRSWASLQRYAHLRQTSDKWARWSGLESAGCPK